MTEHPDPLVRLEEVARAATQGGWDAQYTDTPYEELPESWTVEADDTSVCMLDGPIDARFNLATHIATFDPPTCLALISEVRRLREALERIAHPPYGLGFNRLRGIARAALSSQILPLEDRENSPSVAGLPSSQGGSDPIAPSDLDKAWRAVDALGGTFDPGDMHALGYDAALRDAIKEIEKLGGCWS